MFVFNHRVVLQLYKKLYSKTPFKSAKFKQWTLKERRFLSK